MSKKISLIPSMEVAAWFFRQLREDVISRYPNMNAYLLLADVTATGWSSIAMLCSVDEAARVGGFQVLRTVR